MRLMLGVALALAAFLVVVPVARADSLYTSTFSGALAEVDTYDASSDVIGSGGTIARAAAFDVDGTLYTTVSSGRSLGIFDLASGSVTVVGPLLSTGVMDAIEIDASGDLYGVATDGRAYRIDKSTGAPTYLSNVGVRNIQDLAFDPAGDLWAVALNALYVIDVEAGTATLVGTIGGAREGNVFGIAFDVDARLWATSTVLDAPLYEIDLDTLDVYVVGYTGVDYPRGCDIYAPPPAATPADADGDGVPDEVDAFPNSDMRSTVYVGRFDTGVANRLLADGATIADLVAVCVQDVARPCRFLRRVVRLTLALRKAGSASRSERRAILRAAAKLLREYRRARAKRRFGTWGRAFCRHK